MTKLLVVTPGFHGYGQAIGRAFGKRGYEVVVHEYDAAPPIEKAWNKLRYELPAKVRGRAGHLSTQIVTARAVERLREVHADLVFTVRGDALEADYWQELRATSRRSVVWLYDELGRMTHDIELAAAVSTVATYSRGDVAQLREQGIEAHHVPLAFNSETGTEGHWQKDVISFVGSSLPKRMEILSALVNDGVPVMAYGRDWSDHPVDRLRTWRLGSSGIPAGRDVRLGQAYAIMRDSAATLNIHGDQDGFTMRTFEACGVGAVQIIDRDDVSQFYEPGKEVLVQHSAEETLEIARMVLADRKRMESLREAARARTMAEHTLDQRVAVLDGLW